MTSRSPVLAALVFILACVLPAARAEGEAKPVPPQVMDAVRREETDRPVRNLVTWRGRLVWPHQAAVAVGLFRPHPPRDWDCRLTCDLRGLHAQAEVASGGVQLAAGWASLVGDTDEASRRLVRSFVGWAVRGAVLRTGGTSTLTPKAQTLAGVEGTVSVVRMSFSVGFYRRIAPAPSGDHWSIGGGIGWGF